MELITQIYLSDSKKYIDLYTDIPLSFTYAISDYSDITSRKASFSKQLSIPGTKNNNSIFRNIFDISTNDFNVNRKVNCQVICNSSTIFNGVIRLLKCNNLDSEISYDIQLTDTFTGFFDAINDFGNLRDNIDLYSYSHPYNYQSIIQKSGNTYENVWVYHQLYNANKDGYQITDYFPSIYLKALTDRIFKQIGYTVDCDLFESDNYKNLVIPANTTGNGSDALDSSSFNATITGATSINLSAFTGNYPHRNTVLFNAPTVDLNHLFNVSTSQYVSNKSVDMEFFSEFDVDVYISVNANCTYKGYYQGTFENSNIPTPFLTAKGEIRLLKNFAYSVLGSDNIINGTYLPRSLNAGETFLTSKKVILSAPLKAAIGDSVFVGITELQDYYNHNPNPGPDSGGYDYYMRNSDNFRVAHQIVYRIKSANSSFRNKLANSLVEGDTVNLNNYIPSVTAKDLISTIIKKFNLYVDISKDQPNNLIIKTRDEFYKSTVVKDWTKKIDTQKTQVVSWLSENQPKNFFLKYKDGSDKYNKFYAANNAEHTTYGTTEYVFDNDYLVGDGKFESIFSPTPTLLNGFNQIVPAIKSDELGSELRLLYLCRINNNNTPWVLKSQTTIYKLTSHNTATHFNNPYNPTFDIHFNAPLYRMDGYNSVTYNTISSLYWDSSMQMLMEAKLLTCYLTLNEIDIENLKFSDRIFIDGNYYIVNKVVDFQPNSTDATKVELIKLTTAPDPFLYNEPFLSRGIAQQTQIANNTLIVGEFTNNNSSAQSALIIGENNILTSNQSTIIGSNNQMVASQNNLMVGEYNYSNSDFSIIVGSRSILTGGTNNTVIGINNNVIDSSNVISIGNQNEIVNSDFTNIVGYKNSTSGFSSNIIGRENIVQTGATNASVFGANNIVYSGASGSSLTFGNFNNNGSSNGGIFGFNNLNNGSTNSFIFGNNNTIRNTVLFKPNATFVIGTSNINEASNALIGGSSNRTYSGGTSSITMGFNNKTYGAYGTTTGSYNINNAMGAHIEGTNSTGNGNYSHAEGDSCTTIGFASHAEGYQTTSTGANSHSEGYQTNSIGIASHAEGNSTESRGDFSHAEGVFSTSIGLYSHAEGNGSVASGITSHAEGNGSQANGDYSHTEGNNTIANGSSSHAEGIGTIANGSASHAQGNGCKAVGNNGHAEGVSSIASGHTSHAQGFATTAIGFASHSEGRLTTATGDYSHVGGFNSNAYNLGDFVRSANGLSGQTGINNYIGLTTNATPTELFLGGNERIFLPNNSAYYIQISVVGIKLSNGDSVAFVSDNILIRNISNTVSLVGTPTFTQKQSSAALTTCTVSATADNINKSLNFSVAGVASTNINWNAKLEYTSVLI